MNLFIILPANVHLFIAQVALREEIRPVAGTGKNSGRFILQADIGSAGPHYAAEVAKPHYSTHATHGDDLPVVTPMPTPTPKP